MSNVKVILGEECASQHRLLVGDFRVSIPPQPKHKFVLRIKVWKLRDPGKQAELSEVFKAKTLDSELSQTSTVDERWTSLMDKHLQATKQMCGVFSNHPWRKQTWWWNNQVEEAVREKSRCFKLWKAGGSRAAYNTAKRTSNRAVHQARSEAEKVALQKIDPRSGDVYRLAKQMRHDKGKGDALNRGNYRCLKLIEQVMRVLERVVKGLIRQRVEIDEMQFGFMSGRGTTDAIFIVRQLQEKHLAANKPLYMAFIDLEKAFDLVPRNVIWWAMRKLGIDEWLVRLVQSMYKDVRSRVRVGDGYSEEFGVGVGVHQDSVLSPLLFIIVLEALYREFRTGCPWELLYADDLMISAESMEELLVKMQTWKTEMEKKGLRVNMGKTKIMESGINRDVLKKSGKYPCSVSQSGVGSSNAIFCGCIRNAVALRDPCALTLSSGVPDALGLLGLSLKEKFQRLRLETKSLKLSQSSATLGTCSLQEVAASWLQSHAANVHGASSANCFPFSPTAICPF